jgi:hypothetical protein
VTWRWMVWFILNPSLVREFFIVFRCTTCRRRNLAILLVFGIRVAHSRHHASGPSKLAPFALHAFRGFLSGAVPDLLCLRYGFR